MHLCILLQQAPMKKRKLCCVSSVPLLSLTSDIRWHITLSRVANARQKPVGSSPLAPHT